MTKLKQFFFGLTTLLFFSACQTDKVDCTTFEWGYDYTNGPDLWSQCYSDCGGKMQSPIDITGTTVDASLSALTTSYNPTAANFENNGHSIELTYESGSIFTLDGAEYTLLQAHFHGGSEHTVNGIQYDLEVHLVHQLSDNDLAVISVLVEEGTENAFLNMFIDNLPELEEEVYQDSTLQINIQDIFPSETGYYKYSGSLTTPPCLEVVTWFVMKTPVQASTQQIERLTSIMRTNYRPTQPLKGRTISEFQ